MSRRNVRRSAKIAGAVTAVAFMVVATVAVFAGDGGEDEQMDEARDGQVPGTGTRAPGDALAPRGLDAEVPLRLVHAHAWEAEDGSVPSRSEAMEFDARYSSFVARGTKGLDRVADQGRLSGSGTLEDPYVLERFYVDGDLVIESTERALVVREGYVSGQLKLNYVGKDLLVHHVYGKDLRVNENVRRAGSATGGLFQDNEFGFIGQLRHFSGEFRENRVGPKPEGVAGEYVSDTGLAQVPEEVVFNFDGFQGASVHSNRIDGRVDIKLHGHYHADCLTCGAHDHADKAGFPPEDREEDAEANASDAHEGHDHHASHHARASPEERAWLEEQGLRSVHSVRYHSLHFHDNEIHVEPGATALRYYDRDHRGDDETADSEPNAYLEDPHVHYQYVWLEDNKLDGGPLVLDVFNAGDERHALPHEGVLRVEGNTLRVPYERSLDPHPSGVYGILLSQAEGFGMQIADNRVFFVLQEDDAVSSPLVDVFRYEPERTGIVADGFDRGNVSFMGNRVEDADVPLFARSFTKTVWWSVQDNAFGEDEVESSDTGNPPNEPPPSGEGSGEEGEGDDGRGHDHGGKS